MRMKTIMRNQLVMPLAHLLQSLSLLGGGKKLLAGVSGGADSVALLHGMALLRESHDFSLTAVHVEHGLRGEESKKDASFVQDLCRELHVPLLMFPVDVHKGMLLMRCGMEEAARIIRYDCFQKAMAQCSGDALLLAHHGDDQAETVLMHLMRGSGPAGLSGMAQSVPFAGGLLIRPFLSLDHELLKKALEEEGFPWREDETNLKPEGLRNKLRLQVIPALESLVPGCKKAMNRTAYLMAAEEDWWRGETIKWLLANARLEPALCFLDREALVLEHSAFRRRMARAFLEQAVSVMALPHDQDMTALSFDKTEELMACISGHGGNIVNLPGNMRGERSTKRFFLIPPGGAKAVSEVMLSLSGETEFENFRFAAEPWRTGMELGDGIRFQALDKGMLEGAVFRTRRMGDTFRLLNGEGSKPLKEVLIDRHVDRPFRDMLPILARGPEVLWIPGVGPSGTAAILPGTENGTKLTLLSPLPWDQYERKPGR
jgi:tRNA(Ile)-lysidine synthase